MMKFFKNMTQCRRMCLLMRQNFSVDCERCINKQINLELKAAYEYMSMAYFFNRSDQALPGAFKFFKDSSDEELSHAHLFLDYMNKRGGNIKLEIIPAPQAVYESLSDALHEALKMELQVNAALLEMHEIAQENSDPSLTNFLDTHFLQEQVDSQKKLADYIKQLELCTNNLGLFTFDCTLKKS